MGGNVVKLLAAIMDELYCQKIEDKAKIRILIWRNVVNALNGITEFVKK